MPEFRRLTTGRLPRSGAFCIADCSLEGTKLDLQVQQSLNYLAFQA